MKQRILILMTASLIMGSCGSSTNETKSEDSSATTSGQATATPTQVTPQADAGSTNQKMMDAMNGMMTDMMTLKMTGDPDNDFALMMRSHHKAAVDMVQVYLPGATDATLKNMAQKMQTDQQREIGDFDNFLTTHQASRKEPGTGNELMKIMHKMPAMNNMSANPDQNFAAMMIAHHQSAIDMSQAYLKAAKDDGMKTMAQGIISAQEAEIKQMQDWLNSHK